MKFLELFKKFNSKNRPVNIIYFGKDYHALKQIGKEIDVTNLSDGKFFYNKIRMTAVTPNDNADVITANLKIDSIIIDIHLNKDILNFIKNKIEENPKLNILSSFDNKKLKEALGLRVRKKQYFEYFK